MQISDIDVSLSHGKFLDGKHLTFVCFAMMVCLLLPLITIVLLVIQVEWHNQMIFALVVGNIMFLSFFSVLIYIMIKNNKIKKKIILWLADSISIKAFSKKISENRLGIQPKATKILVRFKIEDKAYVRESTAKVFGGQKGSIGTFNKYADREISILYSPKYDEVLILKDNK